MDGIKIQIAPPPEVINYIDKDLHAGRPKKVHPEPLRWDHKSAPASPATAPGMVPLKLGTGGQVPLKLDGLLLGKTSSASSEGDASNA